MHLMGGSDKNGLWPAVVWALVLAIVFGYAAAQLLPLTNGPWFGSYGWFVVAFVAFFAVTVAIWVVVDVRSRSDEVSTTPIQRFKNSSLFVAMELVGFASVIAVLVAFVVDLGDRREERIARHWQLLATKTAGEGGKSMSLQFLVSEGISVANIDLSTDNMGGAVTITGVDLSGANFRGADLSGVTFDGVDLTGVNFTIAKLDGSSFLGTSLNATDFSGASLVGARFIVDNLKDTNFYFAHMVEAIFAPRKKDLNAEIRLDGTNFGLAALHGASFHDTCVVYRSISKKAGQEISSELTGEVNFAHAGLNLAYFALAARTVNPEEAKEEDCSIPDVSSARVFRDMTPMVKVKPERMTLEQFYRFALRKGGQKLSTVTCQTADNTKLVALSQNYEELTKENLSARLRTIDWRRIKYRDCR